MGLPDSSVGKESACNAEDPGLFPGSGTGDPHHYPWVLFLLYYHRQGVREAVYCHPAYLTYMQSTS